MTQVEVGNADGKITITYNTKVENGKTLELQGTTTLGGVTWNCTGSSLNARYRPSNCRP